MKARNLEELESWINHGLPSDAELRLLRKLASAACDPRVSLGGETPANIILAHAVTEYLKAITPGELENKQPPATRSWPG